MRQFERIHTTDPRAVPISLFIATADTVHDPDRFRLLAVFHDDFPTGRPGRIHQPLHFQTGVHARILAVTVPRDPFRIEGLESGRENYRADVDLFDAIGLGEIDRIRFTGFGAGFRAFAGFEFDTGFRIDHRHQWRRLWKRHVNRFALDQSGIELVVGLALLENAGLDAFQATDAFLLVDIARFTFDLHLEIPDVPLDTGHFGITPERDIGMSPNRRHFRRQNARRTIQRRERLVELGHVPADRRFALD